MFKIINCEQGSDQWFKARHGVITASNFDKIVTKTGKISSKWEDHVNNAVAERLIGGKDEGFQSDAMIRGQSLEYDALNFFNYTHSFKFQKTGFLRAVKNETELCYGCSPDGIDLKEEIGLEMKCPLAHTHINYLIKGKMPPEYFHQVQGALLVTGFKKWIFASYHPQMPCLVIEISRDEEYICKLKKQLEVCEVEIKKRYEKIRELM